MRRGWCLVFKTAGKGNPKASTVLQTAARNSARRQRVLLRATARPSLTRTASQHWQLATMADGSNCQARTCPTLSYTFHVETTMKNSSS